jgi:LPXTG-motif cell wall-anchored protein
MSLSGERLARAEHRSDLARERLRATAERLKARLSPRHLLEDALDEGRRLGETGAAHARQHPLAVGGVAVLLSAFTWFGKRRRKKRRNETETPPESLPIGRNESRRSRRSR